MGYGAIAEGQIAIVPPLSAEELRKHPEFTEDNQRRDAVIVVTKEVIPVADGDLTKKQGITVGVTDPDESFSRYHFTENLQEIVDAYPDHEFTGRIVWTGEDGGIWATVVRNRIVKEIYPIITWPEG